MSLKVSKFAKLITVAAEVSEVNFKKFFRVVNSSRDSFKCCGGFSKVF